MTPQRRKTREVLVGNIGVGGNNPVRIQSMTTTSTRDVLGTAEQIIRLYEAGCEIVRMTVQGKKEAEACEEIRNFLEQKGYRIPLVADIHFYPPAALHVIDFVDKVRINPGNFVDKRATFKQIEYTDQEYAEEILKIEETLFPLIEKAKRLKRSIRIGTNHGSLSDRILNRYGDTPQGMVESAFEFARIFRKYDYHELIFSMKSSNPFVMIQAYRLLAKEMDAIGWDYPLHLGVTEAGEGEDGRVKSAIGMGTLLMEGLGDTIRVSLTEDPWHEIDPCRRIISNANVQTARQKPLFSKEPFFDAVPAPLHPLATVALAKSGTDRELGIGSKSQVDFVFGKDIAWLKGLSQKTSLSKFSLVKESDEPLVIQDRDGWEKLKAKNPSWIVLSPKEKDRVAFSRDFFAHLKAIGLKIPVLLNFTYDGDWEDTVILASAECGSLLCDGLGQGLVLDGPYPVEKLRELSFNILQGCRLRSSKTEFISCPSCGRTLFNLQEVSERIRKRTGHLAGVKIAVMGCIVNGPGEMADADFGYVGSKAGKVDLYVGKECVEKNIDHSEADDRLVALIKERGKWQDNLL